MVYTCRLICPGKKESGRCPTCTNGRPRPEWDISRDPVPCCRSASRPLTRGEVIKDQLLAGNPDRSTWYRCRTCGRSHPYNPSRPQE